MNANTGRPLPSSSLEFVWDLWIAEIIFVEVKQVQVQAVLHLTLAQIVEVRLPVPVLGQIVRYMFGQNNMPGIAALQNPLRDVDSCPCHVCFLVNIGHSIDRAAVNSHPQLDVRMLLQRFADLERTSHWFFRTLEKQERHPVSAWYPDEFARCFCRPKTFGVSHDLIQFLQQLNLLIHQQFRITHRIN